MSPSLAYVIAGYAAGFLVFPFFWSFWDRWPFVEARLDTNDTLFVTLVCAFWPIVVSAVLVCGWWCAMSALGTRARDLCDRAWKGFARWARGA